MKKKKLLQYGVDVNMVKLIKNMYEKTSQMLKINGKVTSPFKTYKGVRQGCILSPRLFNLFINDIPEIFDEQCHPVKIGNMHLQCLMYADDLVILSESKEGLQRSMSKIEQYTNNWDMKLNEKKTKVVTFQKQGPMPKIDIIFNGQVLEHVKQYKYLGSIISRNGGFKLNTKYLKAKGLRARYLVTKTIGTEGKPSTIIKIFQKMVEPILLYNCEIGQIDIPKNTDLSKFEKRMWDFNSERDKVVYGLLRQILGLQKKTTKLGMLAEVGKHPLSLKIYIQTMKSYVRLITTESKLLQNALLEAMKRQGEGKNGWLQQIMFLRQSTKLDNKFELVKGQASFITKFKKALYQKFEEYWQEERQKNGKLRFYFESKNKFTYERYLDKTEKKYRTSITQIRLSSHKLPIEVMRYQEALVEKRICTICDKNETGDEQHYLERCENVAMEECRSRFRVEVEKVQPQFQKMSMENIIHYCLQTHDEGTYDPFGRYVHNMLKVYDDEVERLFDSATQCPLM